MKDITVATLIQYGIYLGFDETHKYLYRLNNTLYAYNGKGLVTL